MALHLWNKNISLVSLKWCVVLSSGHCFFCLSDQDTILRVVEPYSSVNWIQYLKKSKTHKYCTLKLAGGDKIHQRWHDADWLFCETMYHASNSSSGWLCIHQERELFYRQESLRYWNSGENLHHQSLDSRLLQILRRGIVLLCVGPMTV